jgi:hypothetical protein
VVTEFEVKEIQAQHPYRLVAHRAAAFGRQEVVEPAFAVEKQRKPDLVAQAAPVQLQGN